MAAATNTVDMYFRAIGSSCVRIRGFGYMTSDFQEFKGTEGRCDRSR